jgi:putative membrane protein
VVGIVTFAQILGWLFKRYHNLAVALLTGLMVGSLRKIWPWKEVLATITDRHGELIPTVEANILPAAFGSEVVMALGLAIVGFVAVLVLDKLANRNEK